LEYYIYDPSSSFTGASPTTDMLTVINVPFQAVNGILFFGGDENSDWWKSLVFDLLASYSNSSLFVRVNAEGLIFGYKDNLLSIVSTLQPQTSPYFQLQVNQTSLSEAVNSSISTTVYTGKNDITQLGVYKDFKGKTADQCWGDTKANTIRGNDATAFYPGVSMGDHLPVYVDNIFRSTDLVASETLQVQGIQLYNFGLQDKDLENATLNPDNAAYFQFGPNGVINLTSCSQGAPIFVSKPHFLDADPFYLSQLDGLSPDAQLHNTIIAVEPITGVTMSAHKRLQINVKLQQDMLLFPRVRQNLYIPVGWIDIAGEITEDLAGQFKGQVYFIETVTLVLQWGGIGAGIVLFLATIIIFIIFYRRQKRQENAYTAVNSDPINDTDS